MLILMLIYVSELCPCAVKNVKLQGQGHKVKNNGTNGKVTGNIHVKYQNSNTHCSKVIAKVKVFKNGSNSKVKITGSNIVISTERSYHKEYSCEISKL